MVPGNHNSDSFGYNEKERRASRTRGRSCSTTNYKGRVALINDPEIGFIDAAHGRQGRRHDDVEDNGNLTKAEIDDLTKYLIEN